MEVEIPSLLLAPNFDLQLGSVASGIWTNRQNLVYLPGIHVKDGRYLYSKWWNEEVSKKLHFYTMTLSHFQGTSLSRNGVENLVTVPLPNFRGFTKIDVPLFCLVGRVLYIQAIFFGTTYQPFCWKMFLWNAGFVVCFRWGFSATSQHQHDLKRFSMLWYVYGLWRIRLHAGLPTSHPPNGLPKK